MQNSVFQVKRASQLLGLIMLLVFGFMFALIHQQDYALLFGSIGLFITLALVMWVSRRIDWNGTKGSRGSIDQRTGPLLLRWPLFLMDRSTFAGILPYQGAVRALLFTCVAVVAFSASAQERYGIAHSNFGGTDIAYLILPVPLANGPTPISASRVPMPLLGTASWLGPIGSEPSW